ncbi:hypothetical protein VUR80DRAFT_3540 [Thermomyces stellatus]
MRYGVSTKTGCLIQLSVQIKGLFNEKGIKVALLEPNYPRDVTEIISTERVDHEFKAMINTLAQSLDELFTGIVYLKNSGINAYVRTLKGKCIGYAIVKGEIDAGAEIANAQMIELEDAFLRAVTRGPDSVIQELKKAWGEYVNFKPVMGTVLNCEMLERSYADFSKDLKNVKRDWDKVTDYGKLFGVLDLKFEPNYTNGYLDRTLESLTPRTQSGIRKICYNCRKK